MPFSHFISGKILLEHIFFTLCMQDLKKISCFTLRTLFNILVSRFTYLNFNWMYRYTLKTARTTDITTKHASVICSAKLFASEAEVAVTIKDIEKYIVYTILHITERALKYSIIKERYYVKPYESNWQLFIHMNNIYNTVKIIPKNIFI